MASILQRRSVDEPQYGVKCGVCIHVLFRRDGTGGNVSEYTGADDRTFRVHDACFSAPAYVAPDPQIQYVDRYVDRYHQHTTSEHLSRGVQGVGRAIRNNPGRSLLIAGLSGLAIAAVVGVGMYYSQGMELRCIKDLTEDRVAYCAEMPSGLSAQERENYPFREYIAEDQYFPAPGADVRSYSDLQQSGGEEFTHLEWTKYF